MRRSALRLARGFGVGGGSRWGSFSNNTNHTCIITYFNGEWAALKTHAYVQEVLNEISTWMIGIRHLTAFKDCHGLSPVLPKWLLSIFLLRRLKVPCDKVAKHLQSSGIPLCSQPVHQGHQNSHHSNKFTYIKHIIPLIFNNIIQLWIDRFSRILHWVTVWWKCPVAFRAICHCWQTGGQDHCILISRWKAPFLYTYFRACLLWQLG